MQGSGRCNVAVSVGSSGGRLRTYVLCSEWDSKGEWTGRQQADCQGRGGTGGVLRDGMDLAHCGIVV